MARHIRTGDTVVIIAGRDKGKQGRVLRLLSDKDRVVVEGINRVWKHVRPSQRNPQGGRIQKDAPIHISNLMVIDPKSGEPTRVGRRKEGKKIVRYAKKSGELLKDAPYKDEA